MQTIDHIIWECPSFQRERMMELELYETVWPLIHSPNYKIMQYSAFDY